MTKICNRCNQELPANTKYFYKAKGNKDGLNNKCILCVKEYKQEYRRENKEKIKISNQKYYKSNKEKILSANKAWAEENPEKMATYKMNYYKRNIDMIVERSKQWREENRDTLLIKKREYHFANREKIIKEKKIYYKKNKDRFKERYKKYYEENKEEVLERNRRWRLANKDIVNKIEQARKARIKSLEATFTTEDWEDVRKHFNYSCSYCGMNEEEHQALYKQVLHQEHFIPLSKGGEYTHNNIIVACRSCNSSKNDKDFFEWYPEQKFYSKAREKQILEYLNYIDSDIQQLALL